MLGFYNYTVILTYAGALSGFLGITLAAQGQTWPAMICLLVSGFCDMFDGAVARTMERTVQEKRFGIQIDSLSDLVCFGVLPAMIVWSLCGGSTLSVCVGGLYFLCALIRLAWFNVDEEERQNTESTGRSAYLGLPVTTSALIVPIVVSLCGQLHVPLSPTGPITLLLVAAAFLTPFKLKKPALVGKVGMMVCGMLGFCLVLMSGMDL